MKCSSCPGNLYSLLSKFLSPKRWGYGFYPHHWCHCDLGEVFHKKIVQPFWTISLSRSTFFSGNIRNERNKLYCFCLLLIWTWDLFLLLSAADLSSNCSTSIVLLCPPISVQHLPQEKAWCHKDGSRVLPGPCTGDNPHTWQLHRGWGEPCSLPKSAFCLFLSD